MLDSHIGNKIPKVSVCVPSYNHARYIGQCIESVLGQTLDDWELVIVDNSSSDNTDDVVRGYRDPRIRFFKNESNIGAARNWKRCASLARGGYVAFLQSDDFYLPQMLERSAGMLDAHPTVGFTHSGFHRIDEEGNHIGTKQQWQANRVMPGLAALRTLAVDNYITPSTVMMRQSSFHDAGGIDESYQYELDWSMWMRLALRGDVAYIAEPLVTQRSGHSGSLTVSRVLRRPRLVTSEDLRLIEEIFRKLPVTEEWCDLRRESYRRLMDRHIHRTLWLLHQGEAAAFRSEIMYAIRRDHEFPFRYRKIMALWVASLAGANLAKWLDFREQIFWQAFQNKPGEREPMLIVP